MRASAKARSASLAALCWASSFAICRLRRRRISWACLAASSAAVQRSFTVCPQRGSVRGAPLDLVVEGALASAREVGDGEGDGRAQELTRGDELHEEQGLDDLGLGVPAQVGAVELAEHDELAAVRGRHWRRAIFPLCTPDGGEITVDSSRINTNAGICSSWIAASIAVASRDSKCGGRARSAGRPGRRPCARRAHRRRPATRCSGRAAGPREPGAAAGPRGSASWGGRGPRPCPVGRRRTCPRRGASARARSGARVSRASSAA